MGEQPASALGRYSSSVESSPVTHLPCWGAHYILGSGSGFWEALSHLPLAFSMGPARSLVAIQSSLLSGAAPQRFGAKMGSPHESDDLIISDRSSGFSPEGYFSEASSVQR